MKRKLGFINHKVDDKNYIVAVGETSKDYNCIITCNDTALFIWNQLEKERSREDLINAMQDEYGIDADRASGAVDKILTILRDNRLLNE